MERRTEIEKYEEIFGSDFIGPLQLLKSSEKTGIEVPDIVPKIPFDIDFLKTLKNDHILFLSASHLKNGQPITLLTLRDYFGINPQVSEPCFYNQDWYLNEGFVKNQLNCKWNLISKNIFDASRGVDPNVLIKERAFPSAVTCAYIFFVYWSLYDIYLWTNDYVWCSDSDHNNDRIYVGKYLDKDAIKKNGFEIHRHLSLKQSYGAIDIF